MQLEQLEDRCLKYLGATANPMVPINALLEHCRRDAAFAELSEKQLLDFLRPHPLVQVLDAPELPGALQADLLSAAGIDAGPRIILKARIPGAHEMMQTMEQHLQNLIEALTVALAKAGNSMEGNRSAELRAALDRAQVLRDRLKAWRDQERMKDDKDEGWE